MREATRRASTVLLAFIAAVTLFVAYSIGNIAQATHQPADKVAATGSDIDEVTPEGTVILEETMKVSSPADLILQVSAECSILTELTTGPSEEPGASDSAFAFGSVRLHVTIDNKPVPVATDDTGLPPEGQDDDLDDDNEVGEVTFCNRAYERTVTDGEDPLDGIDEEHDFIDTRTANAFSWFALNTGTFYDDPSNGNNILDIKVIADYDTETSGEAVADAFVGSRTLIIEPVHASNHEQVGPGPVEGSPSPASSGPGNSGKPK